MKMIYLILLGMALLLPLARSGFIELVDDPYNQSNTNPTTTEYGASWDRSCDGGTCSMLLYSGVRNADENGTRIENAKSLKDCQFCDKIKLSIDSDGTHLVDVIDYNSSALTADFFYNESNLGEYEYEVEDGKMKSKLKIIEMFDDEEGEPYEKVIEYEIEIEEEEKITWVVPFGFSKVIQWGSNSTELILQDNVTDNLDDAAIEGCAVPDCTATNIDNERGADDECFLGISLVSIFFFENCMFKFDITQIPADVTINQVYLSVRPNTEGLDSGESFNATVHHVYPFPTYNISGEEWTEGESTTYNTSTPPELSWNTRPDNGSIVGQYNTTGESTILFSDGDTTGIFYNWDVTKMVTETYNDENNNITIWIKVINVSGIGSMTPLDDLDMDTKEEGTVANRPYLNVTYTGVAPPPVGVNCTFPNDYGEPKTINMSWFCNTTTAWAKNVTLIDTGWWLVNGTLNLTQNISGDTGQIIYGGSNGTINVGSYT